METPALSRGISLDCHIDVFSSRFHALGFPGANSGFPGSESEKGDGTFYLQSSPEPHMKRLLCRGFPDIYQICKAFRNGESGARHNPEFSMLEWYRKGFSLSDLMDEVELVCRLFRPNAPSRRLTYRQAWVAALGLDPIALDREALLSHPSLYGKLPDTADLPAKTDLLDFVMAHIIEPGFDPEQLTLVHGFPSEQAAQARILAQDPGVAERFEAYGGGAELGNGYLELADPDEYDRRFDAENAKRLSRGKPVLPKDPALLADLQLGLPACAGVAMGVDRLVQWGLGLDGIARTLSFPWEHC